jgi:hypothetical protein
MRLLDFVLKLYRGYYFPVNLSYFKEHVSDYIPHIDPRGKVIVHVGADYGNSALFWRLGGARKVVTFEADERRLRMARYYLGMEPWLEIRGAWDGSYPDGDVLVMDCEGCEKSLDSRLAKYETALIAIHPTLGHPETHYDLYRFGRYVRRIEKQ